MGFIYKITNIITKKCYIGETKKSNPELRWNEHKRKIEKGIGCPALQEAIKKYGVENFKFEVLIICFDEDRYKFEIEYIKKFNSIAPNGYNLTKGGEGGGFYGKKHKAETIIKINNTIKQNYINNPNLIKEISNRNKIIMSNPKHREHLLNVIKNNSRCVKMRENKLSFKDCRVKVSQFSFEGELINSYDSLKHAEIETGCSRKSISSMINGKSKSCGGFIWKRGL
jgi:group I intron endonuclease